MKRHQENFYFSREAVNVAIVVLFRTMQNDAREFE